MLIFLLKHFVRLGLAIFCPEIHIHNKKVLSEKGPILLVVNHPDSFLDAIILGAYYQRKLHFLARGDVFEKPLFGYLLRKIGMIPIHRIREGKEHLHRNSATFQESVEILKNGGVVLIFIEGICLNNHEIQPFKKGATRILAATHALGIFPQIHIASLAYNSFKAFGKVVNICIESMVWIQAINEPKDRIIFNEKVRGIMEKNLFVPEKLIPTNKNLFYYFVQPYYSFVRNFVDKKTKGTVFYDSLLFALLLFTFPLYLISCGTIIFVLVNLLC